MKCVYCQQHFTENLSLREIFLLEKLLPKELCGSCRRLFTLNDHSNKCLGCDKVSAIDYCQDCQAWQLAIPGVELNPESLFCYDEALHDWFQQYKFKGDIRLSHSFSQELNAYFRKYAQWLIVPIPVSASRLKSRGFNQVEELLKAAMVPYVSLLKKQTQAELPQSNKTRHDRLKAPQSFYLAEKKNLITKRRVLIVDDVYTTGRTILHAKECLAQGQPLGLKTFSLAR